MSERGRENFVATGRGGAGNVSKDRELRDERGQLVSRKKMRTQSSVKDAEHQGWDQGDW